MTPPMLGTPEFLMLEVLAYVATCVQLVHLVVSSLMRPAGRRLWGALASGCAVLVPGLVANMLAALNWQMRTHLALALAARGMLDALWLVAPPVLAMAALAVVLRDWGVALAAVLSALWLPPVVGAFGIWWDMVAAASLVGLLLLSVLSLHSDRRVRRERPSAMSVAEALNGIAVGIMVTDGRGGPVFMNAEMRSQLEELGFPTDLGNVGGVWEQVEELSLDPADLGLEKAVLRQVGDEAEKPGRALVRLSDGRVFLAMVERPGGVRQGTRAFSIEVTQLVDAQHRIARANAELDTKNGALARQLANVQGISRQAAFLRMRAAVHDVIGQRLSILQRYLDAGEIEGESLERLQRLMSSVMDDLRAASEQDVTESLEDVVEAFSLAGVRVEVEGELPEKRAIANAFVRVVREASTNACRHGQARVVHVRLEQVEEGGITWETLHIVDDGTPPLQNPSLQGEVPPFKEGSGIAGMRRAIEGCGGTFEVLPGTPFVVFAKVALTG